MRVPYTKPPVVGRCNVPVFRLPHTLPPDVSVVVALLEQSAVFSACVPIHHECRVRFTTGQLRWSPPPPSPLLL